MLSRLKEFFAGEASSSDDPLPPVDDLELATAGLMVEAATLDGTFDETERARILDLMARYFEIDQTEAGDLISVALSRRKEEQQIHPFVRTINDRMSEDEKIRLAEMLWDVVFADGKEDSFEANLMRRLAALIHIGDRAMGDARKRALARAPGMDG